MTKPPNIFPSVTLVIFSVSHLYFHLSSLLYLPIENHEEILKGKWLRDSYTKADPNENMTKNS